MNDARAVSNAPGFVLYGSYSERSGASGRDDRDIPKTGSERGVPHEVINLPAITVADVRYPSMKRSPLMAGFTRYRLRVPDAIRVATAIVARVDVDYARSDARQNQGYPRSGRCIAVPGDIAGIV